jgi:hypothetical protein
MGHDFVTTGVDDLGVVGVHPECFGDTEIEVPGSLAASDHTGLRPAVIGDYLTGWIVHSEKRSAITAIKGVKALTDAD